MTLKIKIHILSTQFTSTQKYLGYKCTLLKSPYHWQNQVYTQVRGLE